MFNIYKLRTLRYDQCDEVGQSTVTAVGDHDSRVMPIGWFLRSRGLDEIPQLWNVLRGDMSLVGPRPHALPHDAIYRAEIAGYHERSLVKPGITGWAQVNGCRGQIRSIHDAERRLKFDLFYVKNGSLWLDIKIVVRTIQISLLGREISGYSHSHFSGPGAGTAQGVGQLVD